MTNLILVWTYLRVNIPLYSWNSHTLWSPKPHLHLNSFLQQMFLTSFALQLPLHKGSSLCETESNGGDPWKIVLLALVETRTVTSTDFLSDSLGTSKSFSTICLTQLVPVQTSLQAPIVCSFYWTWITQLNFTSYWLISPRKVKVHLIHFESEVVEWNNCKPDFWGLRIFKPEHTPQTRSIGRSKLDQEVITQG